MALLADVIHNVGDALTAVPVGIAFLLRSFRAEKIAGLAVVLAIFVSACVALYESIVRLIHPQVRHAAYLNLINGDSPFPSAFDTGKKPSEIFAAAKPFIVSCPPEVVALFGRLP